MRILQRTLSILLFFFCFQVQANEFKQLTAIDGLSQNCTNCIFQDSRGFIWIGTGDGLNRYDGYEFKIFQKQPREDSGLSGNIIHTITEDNQRNLWIGSSDNGVTKYNIVKNVFTSYANSTNNPHLLLSNRIITIKCDNQNNIWILTSLGINIIKNNGGEVVAIPNDSINSKIKNGYTKDIHIDNEGEVWIATAQGLMKINPKTYKVDKKSIGIQNNTGINGIYEWNNHLITYSWQGIFIYNKKTKKTSLLLSVSGVKDIELDSKNNLWVGTTDGILLASLKSKLPLTFEVEKTYRVSGQTGELAFNSILDIFKDNSGLLWFGTPAGVKIYNPKSEIFRQLKVDNSNLSNNKIRSILEDQNGGIWVSTEVDGLHFIPNSTSTTSLGSSVNLTLNPKGHANRGNSIAEDKENHKIWVGAGNVSKLKVFDSRSGKQLDISKWNLRLNRSIFSVLVDSKNTIWLGSYGDGLSRLTPDGNGGYVQHIFKKDTIGYSLPSNIIRSLYEDQLGNIWIGTTNGLAKIKSKHTHLEKPKIFSYQFNPNNNKSISHNYILPIYESLNGDIWIGTYGGGLNRYKQDSIGVGYFETFTTDNGLPNNVIKGILEDDDNNLWISSNKGISRFNIETHEVSNYDIGDGLQDYEFSEMAYCKRKNGELLFGGIRGINAFFPDEIKEDNTVSRVVFTQLDILNQPVNTHDTIRGRVLLSKDINNTKEIELNYSENSFTFYFSGLHFAAPLKNKYKYRLEGFDESWNFATSKNRFAKYTNLKPGKYQLKVLATNSEGTWANKAKSISIRVIAPWWLSNYAFGIYTILFVILLVFFRKYSIIGVQQKNVLLMERFEREKVEELSQLKLSFFTNISHEFRTPLTLILAPLEKILRDREGMSMQKISHSLEVMHDNANVLLRLINQLMDFRKFEQGKSKLRVSQINIVPFIQSIYNSFSLQANEKNIEFNFHFNSERINIWIDQNKVEKIIYNLLSNAFKFTPVDGKIDLELREEQSEIILSVQDNGLGISKSLIPHIFEPFTQGNSLDNNKYGSTGIGLSFTKGLVEIHQARIAVESAENEGSTFSVYFKKGKAHYDRKDILLDNEEPKLDFKIPISNPSNSFESEDYIYKSDSQKETLLIVEDNMQLRSFLKENLKEKYNIISAENGKEGLEQSKQEEIDLIISDVKMPIMSGFEMCKAIKQDVESSHIPIILLTAKTSEEHVIKGYHLGADSYVHKPFNLDILKAQIQNLIEKRNKIQSNFSKTIVVTPSEIAPTTTDEKFLARVLRIIEKHIGDSEFTVDDLIDEYGISQAVLNRKLKALTGQTAKLFIRSIRLKRAAQLLSTGNYSISDVAYEVGFSDPKYFRNCFKKEHEMSPSEYKHKHSKQICDEEEVNKV